MNFLLAAVAALSAVLILPGVSFYFDVVPKVVAILMGAGLACLPAIEWWREIRWRDLKPLRWFVGIAALEAGVTIVAAIFSTHPLLSWIGGTWRRSGVIAEIAVIGLGVAMAVRVAPDLAMMRLLLRITVLASIPVSIYGILQYFGIDPILNSAGYHFGEGEYMIVRPPGTLGHAAYFATYMLYVVFAGVEMARVEARVWRMAAAGAAGLAAFGVVLSGTRAAMLGLVIGAIWMAIRRDDGTFSREARGSEDANGTGQSVDAAGKIAGATNAGSTRGRLSETRAGVKLAAAAIGLLVIIMVFYFSPAGARLRARAFWASEDRAGGSRLLLWRDSLAMAGGRWWIGYGPETFALEFPRHESVALAREYPDFYHESPHNIFLDAVDSKGVAGLALLIGLVGVVLVYARGAIGGGFVAMLVAQQFTTFTLPTELYFYLAAAMVVAMAGKPGNARADARASNGELLTSAEKPGNARADARASKGRRWVVAIGAAPFLGFAIYLTAGDALLATARRAMDHGDSDRAAAFVNRARRWHMSADVYFSRRLLDFAGRTTDYAVRLRALQNAMYMANSAAQTADDRQNALINLASMQAYLNDSAGVERSLKQAIKAAPKYYKSHWLLAEVLELGGRRTEALAEARAAMDLGGDKHEEVVGTYRRLSAPSTR